MSDLTIIIVTYNSQKDIVPCLDSIEHTKGNLDLEIIVVDNNSCDDTTSVIRNKYPYVTLIANDCNPGFPAANNQALRIAQSKYVMLLNPDTIVHPQVLGKIVRFMDSNTECGICGPQLINEAGVEYGDLRRPNFTYYLLDLLGLTFLLRKHIASESLEIISGACFVIRQEIMSNIGFLDEDLFWCEDVDYCIRALNAGYRVCMVPEATVTHLVGQSAKTNVALMLEKQYTSKLGFFYKHGSLIQRKAIVVLFTIQSAVRMLKWTLLKYLHPSDEAKIRVKTFRRLLHVIPEHANALEHNRIRQKG